LLLEEAAGTTGLHARRHETELRLKAAEDNLLRLDDVIATIEAQLQTLKKQARQAQRYRRLGEHIRRTEALLFHARWRAAVADAERKSASRSPMPMRRTARRGRWLQITRIRRHSVLPRPKQRCSASPNPPLGPRRAAPLSNDAMPSLPTGARVWRRAAWRPSASARPWPPS